MRSPVDSAAVFNSYPAPGASLGMRDSMTGGMSAPPDPPGAFHQFINSFGSAVGGLGMRGIGLLLNRFGFGQGNNGVTQSVGGWAIDRNGNLIDQRGQGAPLSYSDSRFRHPLYSQSNQGPAAFARNNTAAVMGRNII